MRLKNKLQYLLLVGLSIIFIACGGGSSTTSSTSSGTFIDSKVIGLRYSTATQSGFTDINGAYKYKNGETIMLETYPSEDKFEKNKDIT